MHNLIYCNYLQKFLFLHRPHSFYLSVTEDTFITTFQPNLKIKYGARFSEAIHLCEDILLGAEIYTP